MFQHVGQFRKLDDFCLRGKKRNGPLWLLNPDTPAEEVLPGKSDAIPVKPGDVLRVLSPGGGGWGDPLNREAASVLLDVKRGLVSQESAKDDYGVVFHSTDDNYELELDTEATEAQRAKLRAARPPQKMFDRGENYYRLVSEGQITPTTGDAEMLVPASAG